MVHACRLRKENFLISYRVDVLSVVRADAKSHFRMEGYGLVAH